MSQLTPESLSYYLQKVNTHLQNAANLNIQIYQSLLSQLNPYVIESSQNEALRNNLASSIDVWKFSNMVLNTFGQIPISSINDECKVLSLRTYRGILLLLRNLSSSVQTIPNELLIQNTFVDCFINFNINIKENNLIISNELQEMINSIFITSLTLLHNLTKDVTIIENSDIDHIIHFFVYPLYDNKTILIGNNDQFFYSYILTFTNLIKSDWFALEFFKHQHFASIFDELIINKLVSHHSNILNTISKLDEMNITDKDTIILNLFKILSCNGSYSKYLVKLYENNSNIELFQKNFKILQLLLTNSEKWDTFQLTTIMSWLFDIFKKINKDLISYFELKKESIPEAEILHNILLISLDIFSTLMNYEHVRKFIIAYDSLETFVSIFDILQKNVLRINFFNDISEIKVMDNLGNKIKDQNLINNRVDTQTQRILPTNFPECKCLIVEILAQLTYRNKDVQDKLRELHALELVLSNCNIDNNDPFIKERSIMCIKFLLENNIENQDIVAKLEAKQAVQDDVLEQAGYEVKIGSNGDIKLSQSQKIEEL